MQEQSAASQVIDPTAGRGGDGCPGVQRQLGRLARNDHERRAARRGARGVMASALERLLDVLEATIGPADPLPATDGWELVLRENVAYLVDDATRDRCMTALREAVGLDPESILLATPAQLAAVVGRMRPHERTQRLRRCAELRIAGAPWSAYPGIGRPGVERIELFADERAVLALDSNAARVLHRLGYGERERSYGATYREIQAAAQAQLPAAGSALQRAHQLLRTHGQTICTRNAPACQDCPLREQCQAARGNRTLADPFAKR